MVIVAVVTVLLLFVVITMKIMSARKPQGRGVPARGAQVLEFYVTPTVRPTAKPAPVWQPPNMPKPSRKLQTPPSYAAHVGSSSTDADGMFNADGTFQ